MQWDEYRIFARPDLPDVGTSCYHESVRLKLRQLRALVVLGEELSFTRAAARLGVAQPALSAQISRIERRLGAKLVERSTRSVQLTPVGRDLLVRARRLLAETDADQLHRGSSG
jgi:DNA-binding transcriptional LysR family regulator